MCSLSIFHNVIDMYSPFDGKRFHGRRVKVQTADTPARQVSGAGG